MLIDAKVNKIGYSAACIVYNTAKHFTSVQVQVMLALYQIYVWWNAANITISEMKLGSARAPTKILSTQNHNHCLLLCRLCYHTDEASYWALWYNVFEVLWSSQDNSFEDRVPVYEPFRYVIFQWFGVTWLKKKVPGLSVPVTAASKIFPITWDFRLTEADLLHYCTMRWLSVMVCW